MGFHLFIVHKTMHVWSLKKDLTKPHDLRCHSCLQCKQCRMSYASKLNTFSGLFKCFCKHHLQYQILLQSGIMGSYWHCARTGEHLSNKWTWNNDKIWDEQGSFRTEVFSISRGVYVHFYYQNDVITGTRSVAGRAGICLKPHSALIQWGKYPFKP